VSAEAIHEDATMTSPPPQKPAQSRLYWPRFIVVYAVLGLAAAGAIAGLVIGLSRSGVVGGTTWSAWQPSGGGLGGVREIADHVAPAYRLPGGNQLVDVIAKSPSFSPNGTQSVDLHYLALRGAKGKVDSILPISPSNSVVLSLCGLGTNCSISTGTPSIARGRLVRREILEMALYAFKYVGGIQNVVAFMPPQPGASPQYVVYLRKADLQTALHDPLEQTLAAKTPLPNTIPAREVRAIDAATEPRTFQFGISQTQLGDWALVLKPLAA
jgi:hypothetical protein